MAIAMAIMPLVGLHKNASAIPKVYKDNAKLSA